MRRARPFLGTIVEIEASGRDAEGAIERAFDAMAEVHRLMSFHDPASDVSRLNREAARRAVTVGALTLRVLEFALDLKDRSDGAFDVSVARHLQARGLLPHHQPDEGPFPDRPVNARGIQLGPDGQVRFLDPSIRIDLGGVAKGFAVDCAAAALREAGVTEGLVNAGGDIYAFGPKPWPILIRDPRSPGRILCGLSLRGEAVASSAGRFDPFSTAAMMTTAIVDPTTGESAGDVIGASVRASSCMAADALTKVVMLRGEGASAVLEHYGASALFVRGEAEVCATANFGEARLEG